MSTAVPPGEFARALQQRRRRARRRRLLGIGAASAVVLLAVLAIYLLYFSPLLAVREVAVSGNHLVGVEEVRAAAAVAPGKPLVQVNTGQVAERVGKLPAVSAVRVERRFPGTVAIQVTERTLVYHRLDKARYDWVDDSGASFRTSDRPEPGVPVAVFTGEVDTRLLTDVATVVSHLPEGLKPLVKQVDVKAVDHISIALGNGDTIVWGSAEDSELKAEVADALLREVDAKVYDVSAPSYPTTR